MLLYAKQILKFNRYYKDHKSFKRFCPYTIQNYNVLLAPTVISIDFIILKKTHNYV